MRKFLIIFGLSFVLAASVFGAETLTLTLTDGGSLTGDILKSDDVGLMLRSSDESYTNIQWAQLSQGTLKQLAANPKIRGYVEPFIAPTAAERPPTPEIRVNPVTRMQLPEHPSILGGLFHSSVGWFILLALYGANLYAAFQIAVVRGKSVGAVVGLSAVLPLVGPIIFLTQPIKAESAPEETASEAMPGDVAPETPQEEIQIVSASWQPSVEEKKLQPQAFSRGKYTFNKRFIETKFAGFIGEAKGDAKIYTMEVRTLKDQLTVECIMQLTVAEVIFETPNGQITVPFADIQEIKLNPKTA